MSNITIEQNNDKFRGVWLPNTFYRQDDMVFDGTSLWVALADFTSGATFDAVNWFCPSCTTIIDENVVSAVSLMKLSPNADKCIRIKRTSDGLETDIGFLNGEVDTASITSFVPTGKAFVEIFYDQTTNGNDWVSTTSTPSGVGQSWVSDNGVIELLNGKPTLKCNTSENCNLQGVFSLNQPSLSSFLHVGGSINPSQSRTISLGSHTNTMYIGMWQLGSGSSNHTGSGSVLTHINSNLIGGTRGDLYSATYGSQSLSLYTDIYANGWVNFNTNFMNDSSIGCHEYLQTMLFWNIPNTSSVNTISDFINEMYNIY